VKYDIREMITEWINAPDGIVDEIGESYYGTIAEFSGNV
jgi:hypothetical protein